ncbi:MAG TPA: RDD family protein [Thermoanaerobaculia bacterium]|nr:RDD family protein [Thermoanaerobaculia bacterium]
MAEAPRDPLAEHPIESSEPVRRRKKAESLDLFPDVGEMPIGEKTASTEAGRTPLDSVEADEDADVDTPGEPIDEAAETAETIGISLARRVAAGLADIVILALVGAVELSAGAFLLDLRFPPPALLPLGAFLFLAALVLLVLAPFVWGTTPGMALADLRIVAADGGSPTLASAFLRFLGFGLTGALAGVPLLVAAFDRRGRTLADLLSGTTLEPAHPNAGRG